MVKVKWRFSFLYGDNWEALVCKLIKEDFIIQRSREDFKYFRANAFFCVLMLNQDVQLNRNCTAHILTKFYTSFFTSKERKHTINLILHKLHKYTLYSKISIVIYLAVLGKARGCSTMTIKIYSWSLPTSLTHKYFGNNFF